MAGSVFFVMPNKLRDYITRYFDASEKVCSMMQDLDNTKPREINDSISTAYCCAIIDSICKENNYVIFSGIYTHHSSRTAYKK